MAVRVPADAGGAPRRSPLRGADPPISSWRISRPSRSRGGPGRGPGPPLLQVLDRRRN